MSEQFDNIEYLKIGTKRQIAAYNLLTKYKVIAKLEQFSPILVGTIPINIDIESSDLDIICHYRCSEGFIKSIKRSFSEHNGFTIMKDNIHNYVVANFFNDGFEIELYGSNIPTKEQRAYRHMIVENNILLKYGEDFRTRVIELKLQGVKTEPAFAQLLGLKGDPYIELLNM